MSRELSPSGLTGNGDGIMVMMMMGGLTHPSKRWDPSEPGVAELLKQGVYLPLPGYDEQVCSEKVSFL